VVVVGANMNGSASKLFMVSIEYTLAVSEIGIKRFSGILFHDKAATFLEKT
jgi:hypothetical protein